MKDLKPESSRIVIFDLDGTLIELPIDYQSLKNELTGAIKIQFQNIFPTVKTLDVEGKKQAFEIIDRYERDAVNKMKIKDGAVKIISELKAKRKSISIVTMQGPVAEDIVRIMKVDKLIDFIVTRKDSLERKEQISMILKKYKASPTTSTVIGDKEADYIAALELGCKGFLVRKINNIPHRGLHNLVNEI